MEVINEHLVSEEARRVPYKEFSNKVIINPLGYISLSNVYYEQLLLFNEIRELFYLNFVLQSSGLVVLIKLPINLESKNKLIFYEIKLLLKSKINSFEKVKSILKYLSAINDKDKLSVSLVDRDSLNKIREKDKDNIIIELTYNFELYYILKKSYKKERKVDIDKITNNKYIDMFTTYVDNIFDIPMLLVKPHSKNIKITPLEGNIMINKIENTNSEVIWYAVRIDPTLSNIPLLLKTIREKNPEYFN